MWPGRPPPVVWVRVRKTTRIAFCRLRARAAAACGAIGARSANLPGMESFGIDFGELDWQAWLRAARDFALPRLLQSLGWIALAAVIYWVSRWVLRRVERVAVARTATTLDDDLVRLLRRLLSISVVFWLLWQVAHTWELGRVASAVVAAWIVTVAFPLSGFLVDMLRIVSERIAPRTATSFDETAFPLIHTIVRILLVLSAVLVALEYLGIRVSPLLAGAGIAGLAISLAAKDTLSNLIAGVLLVVDRPFKVGDRVEVWSAPKETATWGDVIEIGLRATKIQTTDNLIVVVPNNEIMRRDIINYTASGPHVRLRIPIGIAYDADTELAKRLILQAIDETPGVRPEPEPVVIVRSFGASAVNLEARLWMENVRERRAIGDAVTERVKQLFDEHGVEIPYPKRDIYIRGGPGDGTTQPFGGG